MQPFDRAKERHLALLAQARAAGAVDAEAEPILAALNAHPDLVTTSSCAGRVQLLALRHPGDKEGSHVLGRWHAPPFPVVEALAAAPAAALVVLFAEPPIFHVECRDLEVAARLRDLAEACGFKRSALRTFRPGTVLVELAGTDRLEAPVADAEGPLPTEAVSFLTRHAEGTFARGRTRLSRLQAGTKNFK